MAAQPKLEEILQCPITKLPLSFLGRDAIEDLNTEIRNQQFQYLNGTKVEVAGLEAALISSDHKYLYLVVEGILALLPSLAMVRKGQKDTGKQYNTPAETKSVMRYYDEVGWRQANTDPYEDIKRYEDLRPVCAKYIHNCHLRLKRYLPEHGRYLLDAACGPLAYPEQLAYSEGYDYRICVDISFEALKIAKRKLSNKGIFLQCDIACLPLKDGSVDSFVSLHTIYHVPASKQLTAFLELYRVLKDQSQGVVVYSWGRNSWLGPILLSFLYAVPKKLKTYFLRKKGFPATTSSAEETTTLTQKPYLYTWDYAWYRRELLGRCDCQSVCWRSVSTPFLRKYVHQALGGRLFLDILFRLESTFPKLFGKYGQHPIIVFRKTGL